jgi:hypothetical protein
METQGGVTRAARVLLLRYGLRPAQVPFCSVSSHLVPLPVSAEMESIKGQCHLCTAPDVQPRFFHSRCPFSGRHGSIPTWLANLASVLDVTGRKRGLGYSDSTRGV